MRPEARKLMNRSHSEGGALGMLLAWVTSLIVVLLIVEVGFRFLPIPMAGRVVTINEPDPVLGWSKRKDASTRKATSEYQVTFQVNSLGLRDDLDLTREKPADTRRVLVVGDSFVLGYTVEREDHFVDLVEHALQAGGSKVQVLNGGTEGYSTDQELLWLRNEGLTFDPDVVVLCFYQNDVYWNGQSSYVGKPKPRFPPTGDAVTAEPLPALESAEVGPLARGTALGGFFYNLRQGMKYGGSLIYEAGPVAMPREETVTLAEPPASLNLADCWNRTEACLRGFRATCQSAGVPLLLVAIPSREQVQSSSREAYMAAKGLSAEQFDPDLPTRRILAAAEREGIAALDPLPALKAVAETGTAVYFEKDWHLNPRGYHVLASRLYERLVEDDLLGGGTTPAGKAALETGIEVGTRIPTWVVVITLVWLFLGTVWGLSYRDENFLLGYVKIGLFVAVMVGIVLGLNALIRMAGPDLGRYIGLGAVALIFGFVVVKTWSRIGIIKDVYASFVRNGHWYMIPLLVAMLTIGSLLVVASSSPFIAPFIYTLF